MFLFPEKIPSTTERLNIVNHRSGQNLAVEIGEQFQPTLKTEDGDLFDPGYEIESRVFKNEIGNQLNSWFMNPHSGHNGTTVVFFHGNASNIFTHYRQAEPLVENGFRVFIFDYSGYGFSEGAATRKNVLMDGHAAMDFITKSADLKNDNLVLYGQSLGGHLVASIAAEYEDHIQAAVVEGAFSSSKDIAASVAGFIGRWLVADLYVAKEAIQDYHKPLLVVHSIEDETVPLELGEKLYNYANQPKSLLKTRGCHMCGIHYYTEEIVEQIHSMVNSG